MGHLFANPQPRRNLANLRISARAPTHEICRHPIHKVVVQGAVPLSPEGSEFLDSEEFEKWEWGIERMEGHWLPRRFVKAPISWVSPLFARVDE